MPSDELPLKVEVKNGRLCIAIGIDTLAFAFAHSESNNPFNEELGDFERVFAVANKRRFAEDVCRELNREDEDGSTPFTRLLDDVMEIAADQGSLGLKEVKHAK